MKRMWCPLLLSSAATLATATATYAADLPVKAAPIEYVKICSLYGAGFYYIPGTDTCIRIGGHIRAEVSFYGRGGGDPSWFVGDGTTTKTRDQDIFFTRSRVYTNVDTRTQTSFGTLRTFSVVRAELAGPTGLAANPAAINIDTGFIQWGGFTIGRTSTSFFDGPWDFAFKWGSNGSYGWPDSSSGRRRTSTPTSPKRRPRARTLRDSGGRADSRRGCVAERRVTEDQVGALLGDHDRRRVRVAVGDRRHHRGVDDAEAVDAADAQLGIDDRVAV